MLSLRAEERIRARRLDQGRVPTSGEDTRRKRAEETLRLRHSVREEAIAKRRRDVTSDAAIEGESAETITQKLAELPSHLKNVFSNELDVLLPALNSLRRLLSLESRPPIQQCVDNGIIPRLVQLLAYEDHPQVQYEALWPLANISSGNHEQTAAVVNAGAVQALVPLMKTADLEVRGLVVWALANISGDGPECRDFVLRMGAMPPLLSLLTAPNPTARIQRDATWMLSNLCRGKDAPWDIVSTGVPVLARLLYSADNEVLMDACWALLFLTDADPARAPAILSEGIGPQIVSLLQHPSYAVQMPALRVVGNILFGDEDQTQTMMNLNVLNGLDHLLRGDNKKLRKEACWSLTNIAAGNRTQIQNLLDYTSIMEMLFDLVLHGDFATQNEALFVISNAINGGTHEQIRQLVAMGAIDAISFHLDTKDDKALTVALEAISNILDAGVKDPHVGEKYYANMMEDSGGLAKLEDLYEHHSNDIYVLSVKILKEHWPTVDENTLPNLNTNGSYSFASQSGSRQMVTHM